jgi:hypothetical protein
LTFEIKRLKLLMQETSDGNDKIKAELSKMADEIEAELSRMKNRIAPQQQKSPTLTEPDEKVSDVRLRKMLALTGFHPSLADMDKDAASYYGENASFGILLEPSLSPDLGDSSLAVNFQAQILRGLDQKNTPIPFPNISVKATRAIS